jgi:hypothetical protein
VTPNVSLEKCKIITIKKTTCKTLDKIKEREDENSSIIGIKMLIPPWFIN